MKWKSIRFCVQIQVFFPLEESQDVVDPDEPGPQGCQGSQGSQGVQEVPEELTECGPAPNQVPVCFDVINFTSEFELNTIPSAVVSLAIGRQADSVNRAATVHYYIDRMKLQLKVKVWCKASSLAVFDGDDELDTTGFWPECEFLIFDGYVTGSAFRRNQSGAELTLSLTHWLTDLNFSSAISKQSHPLNPSQLYFPSNFLLDANRIGGSFLGDTGPFHTGIQLASAYFMDPSVFTIDFWGGLGECEGDHINAGLKDWLLTLTKFDRINNAQIETAAGAVGTEFMPTRNWEACRALSRFEPNAIVNGRIEEGYVLGVNVGMDDMGLLNDHIGVSLASAISSEGFEGFSNVTLWDKLTGQYRSDFCFSVVPLIEKALVVPFTPGLKDDDDVLVHRLIKTSHYESIDLSATMPRPLRAVGLIVTRGFTAGGGMSGDTRTEYNSSFGGYYDKLQDSDDPRYREGLIMFVNCPRWMNNFVSHFMYSQSSVGANGVPINTSLTPIGGAAHAVLAPAAVQGLAATMWDKYAQSLYLQEAIKGRQGIISGPVRFDIAPGSTVKVEATEDKFVRPLVHYHDYDNNPFCDDHYYNYFYGSVLKVSTVIDSQNMRASTSLYIGYIRSMDENLDDSLTTYAHPIWNRCNWAGCVMIEDPAFNPQSTKTDCGAEYGCQ